MTLAVYTYSNGDVAKEVFNAIATFFATNSFASMLQICTFFAVIATGFHFFMTRDANAIPKWAAVYLMVPLLLINTKVGVQIIDLTDPTGNYAVANVPMIVAGPTYLSSTYMYGVTSSIESIFHSPDDEQYSKTGMVFGAKLYKLSRQSQLEDSQLKGHWVHYLQSCIVGDITLNQKYTWQQLANTDDIFDFLTNHSPSPLRRIQMGPNDFPTCKDALPRLKAGFTADAQKSLSLMAHKLYANKVATNQARFTAGLQGSYAKYAGISRTASQITTQNMAINAIRNGLTDSAAVNGNTAAAFNYAYTQNKMQTTSMWTGMALQAREFLPMMQSILFLLFGCVSILVVALAMLPGMTKLVLSNYIKGFVYLGTWPILFAFINFIMTTRLSLSSSAVANLYNGITLSNVDALAEMHSRYAAMTGMLMMSVPVIVGFIVKGGASVMSNMSHQLAATMGSVNSRTSASAASGDINLGNGQVDNFSFNNMNGNKTDTSALQRTHGMTVQNDTGGMTTTFAGGSQVLDGSNTISRGLGVDLNSREGVSRSLRSSASETLSQAEGHRSQYNESTDKTFDQIVQLGQNTSKGLSYGDTASNKEGASAMKAASTMQSTVEEYAKVNNISHEQAESQLTSGWVGGSLSVGGSTPKLFGLGVSGSAEAGGRITKDSRTSDTTSNSESDRESQALQKQFNESANVLKNYDLTDSSSETRTKTDTALSNIGDSLRDTESLGLTAHTEFSKSQSLNRQADKVEDVSNGVSFNLMPDFQSYMKQENPDHYEGIMYGSTESLREERAGYVRQFMNEPETQAKLERYTDDSLPQTEKDLVNNFDQQTGELALTPAQRTAQQQQSGELQTRHDEGVELIIEGKGVREYFDENKFNTIDREIHESINTTQETVTDNAVQHPSPEPAPQKDIEAVNDNVEPQSQPNTHPAMGRGSR